MTDAERQEIARTRDRVKALTPGAVDLLGALHKEGMLAGWRSVIYVGPPRDINAVHGPFLSGNELLRKER